MEDLSHRNQILKERLRVEVCCVLTSDKGSLKCCLQPLVSEILDLISQMHRLSRLPPQLIRGIMGRKPPSAFLSPWNSFPGGDGFRATAGLSLGLVLATGEVVVVVTGVRSWYTSTLSVRLSLSSSGVGFGGERSWPPPFCTVQSEV